MSLAYVTINITKKMKFTHCTPIFHQLNSKTMSYNILIYADYEYHLLKWSQLTESNTGHQLSKIHCETNSLHNIIPKAIHSKLVSHCIVDINNNIHFIDFNHDNNDKLCKIYQNIGKSTFNKLTIVGFVVDAVTIQILLKNMEHSVDSSYEHFVFTLEHGEYKLERYNIIDASSVKLGNYRVKLQCGDSFGSISHNSFFDLNNNYMPEIHYSISDNSNIPTKQTQGLQYKYGFIVSPDFAPVDYQVQILVDINNDCYISQSLDNYTKFFTMTPNSVILHDNANDTIMIVTDNHFVVVNTPTDIIQFTLPFNSISYVTNTKVRNIIWSHQLYQKLPNNYKDMMKEFMLCNKLMGKFKIPHCVLHLVFVHLIN